MSALRHRSTLEALLRWARRFREEAERHGRDGVRLEVLDTLIEGIASLHGDITERERAIIRAEAGLDQPQPLSGDRLDCAYAEAATRDALAALSRLHKAAGVHADKAETRAIQRDALCIIDALDALCTGVTRPEFHNTIRGA